MESYSCLLTINDIILHFAYVKLMNTFMNFFASYLQHFKVVTISLCFQNLLSE